MKQLAVVMFVSVALASCQADKESMQRISRLEESITILTSRIDSLMVAVDSLRLQATNNERRVAISTKRGSETSTLLIPVFINQTVEQIKSYWETRISVQYFDEGTFTGSEKKYFDIMYGDIGTPEFTSSFDEHGRCESHGTKIKFSDISVIQAKLRNAGYVYSKGNNTWTKAGQLIEWSIVAEVKFYVLQCERM